MSVRSVSVSVSYSSSLLDGDATVTPEQFGAVGDGENDDSAAIQAAATSLASRGAGLIRLRDNAAYLVSTPIELPDGVSVAGNGVMVPYMSATVTGYGSCLICPNAGNAAFLKLGNRSFVRNVNMGAHAGADNPTAGRAIDLTLKYGNRIREVSIHYSWDGIVTANPSPLALGTVLEDVKISRIANRGLSLCHTIDFKWNRGYVMNWGGPFDHIGKGIEIVGRCDTLYFSEILSQSMYRGFEVAATGAAPASDIHLSHSIFDSSGNISIVLKGLIGSSINSCHFYGAPGYGIWCDDAVVDLTIESPKFVGGTADGIVLYGLTDTASLRGIDIHGGHFTLLDGYGINVAAGTCGFNIYGNHFSRLAPNAPTDPTVRNMQYAIKIEDGASDHYQIHKNTGHGLSGGVYDGGTGVNKYVEDCLP